MNGDTLTAHQRALRDLALRQLEAAHGTLRRCLAIIDEQGDREAVFDALCTANAQQILPRWFWRRAEAT